MKWKPEPIEKYEPKKEEEAPVASAKDIPIDLSDLRAPTQWNIADEVLKKVYGEKYSQLETKERDGLLTAMTKEMMKPENRDMVEDALMKQFKGKSDEWLENYIQKNNIVKEVQVKDPVTKTIKTERVPQTPEDLRSWLDKDAELNIETKRFNDMLSKIKTGKGTAAHAAEEISGETKVGSVKGSSGKWKKGGSG